MTLVEQDKGVGIRGIETQEEIGERERKSLEERKPKTRGQQHQAY